MTNNIIENNTVQLIGEIAGEFVYSHEVFGEAFYSVDIKAKRLSEAYDKIPVIISERLLDIKQDLTGKCVEITGNFRSYNKHTESGNKLVLSVFVREIMILEEERDNVNVITLEGFICKEPIYRVSPLKREIGDVLLAVNRPYGKSDYIPCILWGRNAKMCKTLSVSDCIKITGRIQSREYQKKISETETEARITYEVSVSKINTVSKN